MTPSGVNSSSRQQYLPGSFIPESSSVNFTQKEQDGCQTKERNSDMPALEKPLHIDIPVKLAEVRIAFSVPALAFEGDLPASIFHLQLIENDIADWNAKAQVIAVFHTNAGHV